MPELQQYDKGSSLRVSVRNNGSMVNIGSASVLKIKLKEPSGTTITKTATLVSGPSGIMEYVIESGVLDEQGTWKIQGYVEIGSQCYHTEHATFTVNRNL